MLAVGDGEVGAHLVGLPLAENRVALPRHLCEDGLLQLCSHEGAHLLELGAAKRHRLGHEGRSGHEGQEKGELAAMPESFVRIDTTPA